ncbi:hypothetical protein PPTG_13568 [Phytophthora nicotianae INRA-310]|uniref:Secreted protein n=1 Tax=Phytophthora nicotianae (strain INRA-310) TaxID=761204 RepID=W2Q2V5_PHYN3|nr:hypothetical protein PPTG_13568 [Phytophthora nicotianae INRA-310]ETN07206.1 hypothetical protein PPTG_13568 [Phytophthora nicotianae INRA-310]
MACWRRIRSRRWTRRAWANWCVWPWSVVARRVPRSSWASAASTAETRSRSSSLRGWVSSTCRALQCA